MVLCPVRAGKETIDVAKHAINSPSSPVLHQKRIVPSPPILELGQGHCCTVLCTLIVCAVSISCIARSAARPSWSPTRPFSDYCQMRGGAWCLDTGFLFLFLFLVSFPFFSFLFFLSVSKKKGPFSFFLKPPGRAVG